MINNDPFVIERNGDYFVGFSTLKQGVAIVWSKSKSNAYPFKTVDFAHSVSTLLELSCRILRSSKA